MKKQYAYAYSKNYGNDELLKKIEYLNREFPKIQKAILMQAYNIVKNHHDTEDILQDTFITARSKIGQLKDEASLKPWIFSIARNTALKKYNHNKREVPVFFEYDSEEACPGFEECAAGLMQPEEECVKNEFENYLKEIIGKVLAPGHILKRDIFFAYYFDKMSFKEIQAKFGISTLAAVKSSIHRTRQKVEPALKNIFLKIEM